MNVVILNKKQFSLTKRNKKIHVFLIPSCYIIKNGERGECSEER